MKNRWLLCLLSLPAAWLCAGDEVRINPDIFQKKIIVESGDQRIVFNREDAAGIVEWTWQGRVFVRCPEKGHRLAAESLWSPRRLFLAANSYELKAQEIGKESITLVFRGKIDLIPVKMEFFSGEGWWITKKCVIARNRPAMAISYTIENAGKHPRYFSFWFHNWLDFASDDAADYLLLLPGVGGVISRQLTPVGDGNLVFPVPGAPFTRNNEVFEKKYRGEPVGRAFFALFSEKTGDAFTVRTEYDKLLQVYTNFAGCPTLECMFQPCTLQPGESWNITVNLDFRTGMKKEDLLKEFSLPVASNGGKE